MLFDIVRALCVEINILSTLALKSPGEKKKKEQHPPISPQLVPFGQVSSHGNLPDKSVLAPFRALFKAQSRCRGAEGSQADKRGDSRSCLIYRQAE